MSRIKFYDDFECKNVMVELEEVKKHFQEFKGVDYENFIDYMNIHAISDRHMKHFATQKEMNAYHILKNVHNEEDFTLDDILKHKYIVVGIDSFLSGWGRAKELNAKTILLCDTMEEVRNAINKMKNDNFRNLTFYGLDSKSFVRLNTSKDIYTLRKLSQSSIWR